MPQLQRNAQGQFIAPKKRGFRFFTLKRQGPHKLYRLKGYTTVAELEKQWKNRRRNQRFVRLLITLIIVIVLVLLYYWINPVPKIREFIRIIGGEI